ncbi:MAG: HAD family phosphatase [archaeon]
MRFAIFDLDGTLVDTLKPHVDSFIAIAEKYGVETNRREIEDLFGVRAKEIYQLLIARQKLDLDAGKLAEEKYAYMQAHLKPFELLPGVKALLEHMQSRKIKMAVATGTSKPVLVKNVLGMAGILQYFDKIITAEEVSFTKPDPEIYLKAISALDPEQKYPKSEFLAFEDSTYGVQAAHGAGLRCVAVATGRAKKVDLTKEKPYLLLDTLEDAALKQIL